MNNAHQPFFYCCFVYAHIQRISQYVLHEHFVSTEKKDNVIFHQNTLETNYLSCTAKNKHVRFLDLLFSWYSHARDIRLLAAHGDICGTAHRLRDTDMMYTCMYCCELQIYLFQ